MINQRENICHGLFVLADNHASRGDSCPGNGFEFQLANAVRCCSQDGTKCITPQCISTLFFKELMGQSCIFKFFFDRNLMILGKILCFKPNLKAILCEKLLTLAF